MTVNTGNDKTKEIIDAICKRHTGKMEGMMSISTYCDWNPHCLKRMKEGNSICAKCYASRQTKMYKTLAEKLKRNTKLLTREIIPIGDMPFLNLAFFRFESFGDLVNVTQLKNYFNMCWRNPHIKAALWTKNTFLLEMAREQGIVKPTNLVIVESSPKINEPVEPSDEWVDKVFTVWDKTYKDAEFINCGQRKCLECLRCYIGAEKEINEILK